MKEYPKINSIFKRDAGGKFIEGNYSCPEFEFLAGNKWVWTEKVDGTNVRVMWDKEVSKLRFGGRTDNAQFLTSLYECLCGLFPLELFKDKETMCLYGEGYGAKIQKGGGNYKKDGVGFVLFDILMGNWWLKRDAIEKIAEEMGIECVPIAGEGTLSEAILLTQGGFKSKWGDFTAEGLVLKPAVELTARNGNRIITKVKCRDFGEINR